MKLEECEMAKLRKESLTMNMYMEFVKDGDIREDADVQRASGQWTNEQVNELIVTVLTDGYIPPIFIGEDLNLQKWLLDGLQRTTSLRMFRFGNYKITSSIRNPIIKYRERVKDEKGNPIEDENGDYVWNDCVFDIKNRTYNELPDELKKQFNRFQIDTVIFEECTMAKMSDLILIYNNHTGMNTAQKAVTYISEFARNVKDIVERPFFIDYSNFTEKEKIKGVVERVVLETVMCMFHLDNWKKQAKQIASYLNGNSSKEEFEKLDDNLHRLENVITDDIKSIFNSKDSFIWLTLFNRFCDIKIEDNKFAEFLREFKNGLRNKAVDGKLFDTVDTGAGTKDKAVIIAKLHILETLMLEYLHIEEKDIKVADEEIFIANVVEIDESEVHKNIDIYKEDLNGSDSLKGLKDNCIRDGSKLLDAQNNLSLLAMVAYSYKIGQDLDEWLTYFASRNNTYFVDQRKNFYLMRDDFNKYLGKGRAA